MKGMTQARHDPSSLSAERPSQQATKGGARRRGGRDDAGAEERAGAEEEGGGEGGRGG